MHVPQVFRIKYCSRPGGLWYFFTSSTSLLLSSSSCPLQLFIPLLPSNFQYAHIGHERPHEKGHPEGNTRRSRIDDAEERQQGKNRVRDLVDVVLERPVGYRPRRDWGVVVMRQTTEEETFEAGPTQRAVEPKNQKLLLVPRNVYGFFDEQAFSLYIRCHEYCCTYVS